MEMNEKLLEAHKMVVQKNLKTEVARDLGHPGTAAAGQQLEASGRGNIYEMSGGSTIHSVSSKVFAMTVYVSRMLQAKFIAKKDKNIVQYISALSKIFFVFICFYVKQ